MERKGGCCLAPRCGGDGGQAWQMGNIMLKFRPIAPKPAAMAPAPVTAPATVAGARKGKRKAAAGGAGRRGRKPKKAAAVVAATAAPPPTPKADVHKENPLPSPSSSGTTSVADSSSPPPPPTMFMHASSPDKAADLAPAHLVASLHALRPVASCVTVEAVTATWSDGASAPSAPASGGEDDAPAFASDRWGRVTWTNLAFSRAAFASDVVLAARDGAAVPAWGACAGFTCRVRVACGASPRRGSLVAPCDVWRVGDGGYLWRLDLRTTLTLSLGGTGLL
ncbi:predicted GPI-anchored protein 58 [Lolium rigidum]|uniref:predicted GPI-anchored protein 58 n=1 Tax=Lolium rigidum TaxID=89674 RepID=UPI001F5CDF14|nr:predicted GPI-anchored protein 58 [Lolium rigidum]